MHTFGRPLLILALSLQAATAIAQPGKRSGDTPAAPPPITQLIVKLRAPAPGQAAAATETSIAALSEHAGLRLQLRRAMSGGATVLQLPEAAAPAAAQALARRLAQSPQVEYASPDYLRRPALTPNDNRFGEQWHLLAPGSVSDGASVVGGANFPAAWDISTGSASTIVAIVDTGVLPHPELTGRLLPGYDFISSSFVANDGSGRDSDAGDPGDWVSESDTARSECSGIPIRNSSWHGTHVAGIAAARGGNGSAVAGASWETQVLPVRVLGKCGGYDSDIIDAIRWSAGLKVSGVPSNPYPADVINLSLTAATACTAAQQAAFDDVHAAGVAVVAATGNGYGYSVASPANCDHVIAVTAHAIDGTSSTFANVGTETAISAPGGGAGTDVDGNSAGSNRPILSLGNSGTTSPTSSYTVATQSGTSQATPHVAGVIALLRAQEPGLAPDRIRELLTSTARPFPAGSWCTLEDQPQSGKCGAGLLDAGKALQAAALIPNSAPSLALTGVRKGQPGRPLQFQLSASDVNGDPLTYTALELPEGATLSSAGLFRWETPALGEHRLLYQVSDGEAVAGPATVTIRIQTASSGGGGGGTFPPFLLIPLAVLGLRHLRWPL